MWLRCYLKASNTKTFKEGAISGPANCSDPQESSAQSADCFDMGVGYNYGDYLVSKNTGAPLMLSLDLTELSLCWQDYFTVSDTAACQERCQQYSRCSHFSFYTSNRECYMKTGNDERRQNSEVISGPKYCGGAGAPQELGTTTPDPCAPLGNIAR